MKKRLSAAVAGCIFLAGGALSGQAVENPKRIPALDDAARSPQQYADTALERSMNMNGNNGPFPRGGANTAYAKYFVGNSYLNMFSTEGVTIGNVTFEPGCRNNWHIHHASKGGGQILLCTAGRGWYQEWGKPAQELHAGDVAHIPAGVKHWHGAAGDSWFTHLAVEVPGENSKNEWLEPVSDAEYEKLP